MSDGLRLTIAYSLAVLGGWVYVKLSRGVPGLADAAVFAVCVWVFSAPGIVLTHGVEPGGLRRWRRSAR